MDITVATLTSEDRRKLEYIQQATNWRFRPPSFSIPSGREELDRTRSGITAE